MVDTFFSVYHHYITSLVILYICFSAIIISCLCLIVAANKTDVQNLVRKTGEIEKYAHSTEPITLVQGNTITIDSREVLELTEKYKLSNIENAAEKTLTFILEREALYLAATKAGYSTSRDEAQQIVVQMKKSFHEAENFNDFLLYLEGAEMTEDEYWAKQIDVVAKENTMARFVNDQKTQLKLKTTSMMYK